MISGFRRNVAKNCALLYYNADSKRFGTTYRFHPQGSRILFGFLKLEEASVRHYHYSLLNKPEKRRYRPWLFYFLPQ